MHSSSRRIDLARLLTVGVVCSVLIGCSGDTTGPAPLPATKLYTTLVLNYHAINMDTTPPYNTVQLSATPLAATGAQLVGVDSTVHYSDLDSSITISPTGLVTAHYPTVSTQVVASLTVGGVIHTDTADIQVTNTAFTSPLATFSIQPLPLDLDSADDAVDDAGRSINNGSGTIPVYATTATGDSVCSADLPCQINVHFTSSDPTIASIDNTGLVTPFFPGRVKFIVSTLAYGINKADTLTYTIGYPILFLGTPIYYYPATGLGEQQTAPYFFPSTILVGVGARIGIKMIPSGVAMDSVDVVFDDSTLVTGGRTRYINTGGSIFYQFGQPGSYTYRSRNHGGSGTVVVISNRNL